MDSDLDSLSREQLLAQVRRLRAGIRSHRDASGHDLCWHHPALWGLLPERTDPLPVVPEWPQFLEGCIRYRQSLDRQAAAAPRSARPYAAQVMRTQYYTASSLDGFIATEDDSLEWLFPLGDVNDTSYPRFIAEVGALAMGRSTYEWMLRHVVKPESATPGKWPYTQPAWVFTHGTLPGVPGAGIRFVQGDVRAVHEAMRAAAGGRNLWIVGGGELVGQFHDAGLLDEIIVQVSSVTLGRGKPLLPRRITSPALKLTGVQQFGPGFAELRYEVPRSTGRP